MNVLYLDTYFLINFMINFFLLITTAALGVLEVSKKRMVLSACCGGLYAIATIILPYNQILLFHVLFGWILCIIAFGYGTFSESLHRFILFLLVSFLCAGSVCAICFLSIHTKLLPNPNDLFTTLGPNIVLGSSVVVCLFSSVVLKGRADGKKIKHLTLYAFNNKLQIRALVDTGNTLRDPLTNTSVLIMSKTQAMNVFSKEIQEILQTNDVSDAATVFKKLYENGFGTGFFLLPYRSIGISDGILLSFVAKEADTSVKRCIALCEQQITDGISYDAIIGI